MAADQTEEDAFKNDLTVASTFMLKFSQSKPVLDESTELKTFFKLVSSKILMTTSM